MLNRNSFNKNVASSSLNSRLPSPLINFSIMKYKKDAKKLNEIYQQLFVDHHNAKDKQKKNKIREKLWNIHNQVLSYSGDKKLRDLNENFEEETFENLFIHDFMGVGKVNQNNDPEKTFDQSHQGASNSQPGPSQYQHFQQGHPQYPPTYPHGYGSNYF